VKTLTLTDEQYAILAKIMHHSNNNGNGWYHTDNGWYHTEVKKASYLLDEVALKELQKAHRSLFDKVVQEREV
jgi:hypothetical protein